MLGYFFEGRRFDAGTTLGYIETLIHVALQRAGHARIHPPAPAPAWSPMRNYETFATTADVGIRFRGHDFARTLRKRRARAERSAFRQESPPPAGDESCRHFRFRGDGPENVLVNFLAEVLALAYQRR